MLALSLGVMLFGYSVLYFGLSQKDGGNWGYLDLVVPSRWTTDVAATPKDGANG